MHGGYHDDDENHGKSNTVDTISLREKVKLARSEKWRILKNIIVVSLAFMIQFTAFQVSKKSLSVHHYFLIFLGNGKLAIVSKHKRFPWNNFISCNLWRPRDLLHFPTNLVDS